MAHFLPVYTGTVTDSYFLFLESATSSKALSGSPPPMALGAGMQPVVTQGCHSPCFPLPLRRALGMTPSRSVHALCLPCCLPGCRTPKIPEPVIMISILLT